MLDLARLKQTKIVTRPKFQRVVASVLMSPNFWITRPKIVIEGLENLPRDRPCFLAMNHTDHFNYWPLMWSLWRRGGWPFLSVWVKGKYYEGKFLSTMIEGTNNIPIPSRGYVLTTEFRQTMGRPPKAEEYQALRALVDDEDHDAMTVVGAFLEQRGGAEAFRKQFITYFGEMMREVVRIHADALDEGKNHILVFPQGTRSIKLSKGHTGLVQIAHHLGADIVPIGCNGNEKLYPTLSPWCRGGTVTYRIGAPIRFDEPEMQAHHIEAPFIPFTREATARHGAQFEAMTAVMMNRLNGLLDPKYQFADDKISDGVQGMNRFL